MNKKFLSAILFGALMVTSTGTFVSCKDYDDDIKDLQGQIDANKAGIEELKKLIGEGDYVTNVAKDGDNIVVSFKNAGNKTIELKDEVGSICKVENGELYIDNKATGIKVSADAPVTEFKPAVKVEDGKWAVLQEDGTYKTTGIPASGVTVAGSQTDGFTLTIYDKDGKATEVKLPTATSRITGLSLGDNRTLTLAAATSWNLAQDKNVITKASDWKGPKTLPNAGDVVYSNVAEAPIDLRINPVDIDATGITFTLTNSKNETLNYVELTAKEYKEYQTVSVQSKAAYGNGLYSLVLDNFVVAKANADDFAEELEAIEIKGEAAGAAAESESTKTYKGYAVNANSSYRTAYQVVVNTGEAEKLTKYNINADEAKDLGAETAGEFTEIEVGKAYEVTFDKPAALYDMFFDVKDTYKNAFGVTWDNATHKFTVGKNPDEASLQGEFPMDIYTVDNTGKTQKTSVKISLSTVIAPTKDYQLITKNIADKDNYFNIDLALMKSNLGAKLQTWALNADISNTTYALYGKYEEGVLSDEVTVGEGESATSVIAADDALFTPSILKESKKDAAVAAAADEANYIRLTINNEKAEAAGMKLNTTYYVSITFKDKTAATPSVLNSIVVPVKFVAPALSEAFEIEPAFQDKTTNAINAYFYLGNGIGSNGTVAEKSVLLTKYFKKYLDTTIAFKDDDKLGEDEKASTEIAIFKEKSKKESADTPSATASEGEDDDETSSEGKDEFEYKAKTENVTFENIYVGLNEEVTKSKTDKREYGYGEALTVIASADDYEGWKYTETAEKEYSFQIKLMSPIYEGTVSGVDGKPIEVNRNDLKTGASITSAMIKGYDYTNKTTNAYNVVPDAVGENGALAWADPQIEKVEAKESENDKPALLTEVKMTAATGATADKHGKIVVKGESTTGESNPKLTVTVTDIWGYVKACDVTLTLK